MALKQLHSHLVSQPLAMARLRVEASTAGQVQHPHVLSVLGLWHHRGHDLLVSEYCDGPALETLPAHAQDVALAFAYQVATALEVAHLTGRVHGDVRPGNVLIGPDGAMLFDFGIATLLQKFDVIKDQFRPGQTAPEVQQGAPRSVRSDLYGVGVVLFFALYGHMPFDGPTPFAIVGRQRQGVPDVSRQANGVAALLRDLLQPNPVQRPRSVTAVIKALERLRRSPNRVISLGKNWLAPTRFRRSWIVHGIDPQTRAPAVFAQACTAGSAHAMVKRLRSEGWEAERTKEALSFGDLVWATALGLVLSVPFNILGGLAGVGLGLRWRSNDIEPRILEALPQLSVPMPPLEVKGSHEEPLVAGLLMLLMVPLMLWWPMFAVPPGVALLALTVSAWRRPQPDAAPVLTARVSFAIAETERLIEQRKVGLDAQLVLQGECREVEMAWRHGSLNSDEALLRVEALSSRVRTLPGST